MEQFKSSDKKKVDEILSIAERNRMDRLRKPGRADEVREHDANGNDYQNGSELTADDVRVVLFAAPSLFATSIIKMAETETVITHFEDHDAMMSFCMEHSRLSKVFIDLDPPSDVNKAINVYMELSMAMPAIKQFVFTIDKSSSVAETLKLRGGVVVQKPILRKQFLELLM
jgi:hypothetical protein